MGHSNMAQETGLLEQPFSTIDKSFRPFLKE